MNDIPKVFKQFTELRSAKTSNVTIGGRQAASSIFNQDQGFCKQRNLASKNMDHKSTVVGIAKLWVSGLPINV